MVGLISIDNLLFEAVLVLLLNKYFIIGILAKKGTPEPELFFDDSSIPPKITTSLSFTRIIDVNSLESMPGGASGSMRSPLKLDCSTLMLNVIFPSPETSGRMLIDKSASMGK